MLRYENIGDKCLKIDLHNRNYSIVAIAKWIKETDKYNVTFYLKENTIDMLELIEKYENVEYMSEHSSIKSDIAAIVTKLNDEGFFDYYMDRYDMEQKCFDLGLEIIEKERN